MTPRGPWFTGATLGFLAELAANNDRSWFRANRARYERDVKEPALRFVTDVGPALRTVSPRYRADPRPVGGSLFRIHRDVRFSRDKSPYKTHVGVRFPHEAGKDVHAPGFYLHVEPGGSFFGCGMWRPASGPLRRVREAIVEDPDGWVKATRRAPFTRRLALGGDALKTHPRGFDPAHPLIEDLRRTDVTAFAALDDATVTGPDLLEEFVASCRAALPFQRFLCRALGAKA